MRTVFLLIREQHQNDRPDGWQVGFPQHARKHVTGLLHLSQAFARRAIAGVADDAERSHAVFGPVRGENRGCEQNRHKRTAKHLDLMLTLVCLLYWQPFRRLTSCHDAWSRSRFSIARWCWALFVSLV